MRVKWVGRLAAACVAMCASAGVSRAEEGTKIGEVSTTFRFLGHNDRIVVDRYDDPKVDGVSCYMSRAVTGGISGTIGVATDPSRFSIACRATGKVVPKTTLPPNEVVFGAHASFFFKDIRVSRIVDPDRHVLVYLVWSTKALSTGGSPYNAVSAVPMGVPAP